MTTNSLYFVYGLCVMFYAMMAWTFWRKNSERLMRLVALLMATLAAQSVKDLFYIEDFNPHNSGIWMTITSLDMVAVPMYAFTLIELCRPNRLTLKKVVIHELPFVAMPLLLLITGETVFYDIETCWAAIYGCYYAIWTLIAIPSYHRHLKQCYSYIENVNLNWLRVILFSYFIILGLWVADCLVIDLNIECAYMASSLIIWMFICYFIYRHESVIDELDNQQAAQNCLPTDATGDLTLDQRIAKLFRDDRIYLNPRLKLSDVARLAGTNRTYLSKYFNRDNGMTFYDFINNMRIDHACKLLTETDSKVEDIAYSSGFNSLSTFRRSFIHRLGCTPTQYRGIYPPPAVDDCKSGNYTI